MRQRKATRRVAALMCVLVLGPVAGAAHAAGGADLRVLKSDSPDPVAAGANISYDVQVYNNPNTANSGTPASNLSFSDTLPANTTLVSVTVPGGWTRTDAVPVGGTGTVTATKASLGAGAVDDITVVV